MDAGVPGFFGCGRTLCVLTFVTTLFLCIDSQRNPTILQDSRDLPTPEGHFGFLYRTEDGIAHGARGDPNGQVHGRFTYTDPTGLKVNFNYNAGSRATPGYNYNNAPEESAAAPSRAQQYEEPAAPRRAPAASARAPAPSARTAAAPADDYYDQPEASPGRTAEYYEQPRRSPQPNSRYNDVGY